MEGKYPPCLNKNCKSYGKPHPNCRCWGGKEPLFADGGDVGNFCDSDNQHMPECEHYSGASFPDAVMAKRKVRR